MGQRLPTSHDRRRFEPALRGYHAVYRSGEVNHCPACGRTHWYVGRLLAECGFCAAALPLNDTGMIGAGLFRHLPRVAESTWEKAA